jgi:hypothetical protein
MYCSPLEICLCIANSSEIVTRQSASLAGQIASPIADVDHNTICKFDSKFGGFMQVAAKLRHIRDILLGHVGAANQVSNV